jgi:DNA (cytosine-5)-methyltransferase 1
VDITETTHISLCSGYGGIDLGLRRVLPDVRTIAYVEIEAFACANLVEKMESQQLDEAPIWTNLKSFDAKPFQGKVDILSGGFPCQPFSAAGQRKGTDDPRHLFPDIERIILECTPNIVFLENVEGIISAKYAGEDNTSVLKYVLERLEKMGYTATAGVFSAEELSAPHRRKRVFICGISNTRCDDATTRGECEALQEGGNERDAEGRSRCDAGSGLLQETGCCSKGEVANTDSLGCGGRGSEGCTDGERVVLQGECGRGEVGRETEGYCEFPSRPNEPQHDWEYPRTIGDEETIPTMGGTTHGSANGDMVRSCRVDALRLLGNGVVPVVAAKAFVVLMARVNEGVTMK